MLPINWLNHCEDMDVNMDIAQNFYNAYFKPKSFFYEKDFDIWDPKIHSIHNYLQSFYAAAFIDECMTNKQYPFVMF